MGPRATVAVSARGADHGPDDDRERAPLPPCRHPGQAQREPGPTRRFVDEPVAGRRRSVGPGSVPPWAVRSGM